MKIVTTFHPSSSVVDSLKCKLVAASDIEYLVSAKLNRLQVSSIRPEGLQRECEFEVWGRISAIKTVPVENAGCKILVLTDHPEPELIFLAYILSEADAPKLKPSKYLSLFERSARPSEFYNGILIDPSGKLAVASCYAGRLKVVLLAKDGNYDSDFDVSIMELNLLALAFVPGTYTLAILHVDHQQRIQLLSRDISIEEYQLSPSPSTALPSIPLSTTLFSFTDALPHLIPIPMFEDDDDTVFSSILVLGGKKIFLYDITSRELPGARKGKQRIKDVRKRSSDAAELNNARQKETDREWKKKKARASVEWPWSNITAWCAVDRQGRKFLLGDEYGRLALLSVTFSDGAMLTLVALGESSPATTLTYLTNQTVYIGSHFGDSQLLRISSTPVANYDSPTLPVPSNIGTTFSALLSSSKGKDRATQFKNRDKGTIINGKGSHLSLLESHKNLAPIIDAILVDPDRTGQLEVVTCSGGKNTGSINVVRNGADFQESAVIRGLVNITNIWPIRPAYMESYDSHVLVSTLHHTHVFKFAQDATICHAEIVTDGFVTDSRTLAVGNVLRRKPASDGSSYTNSSLVVQVFPSGLLLLEYHSGLGAFTRLGNIRGLEDLGKGSPGWFGREIVAASVNASQIVLGLSGGRLVLLNMIDDQVHVVKFRDLIGPSSHPAEISAVSCVPLDPSKNFSLYIAVSFWTSNHVEILSLRNPESYLMSICKTDSLISLPRSLLLYNFASEDQQRRTENHPYLLIGLADGSVATYAFRNFELHDQKIIYMGDLPVSLHACEIGEKRAVFACGSRTSIMFWDKERLHHSSLMLRDISAASRLNTSHFPASLMLASCAGLVVGTVTNLDKLSIRTHLLGFDNPRRISYDPLLKCFGVVCSRTHPTRIGDEESVSSSFQLIDGTTFTKLSHFNCPFNEELTALVTFPWMSDGRQKSYFCCGSTLYDSDEQEPSEGRLIIFAPDADYSSTSSAKAYLEITTSVNVNGCVYALAFINDLLVAAVNSSVVVFRPEIVGDQQILTLQMVAEWNHNYLVTSLGSCGNQLAVGDAISSISLLHIADGQLQSIARDYSSLWPVCIAMLDERSIIGADSDHNMFTFSIQQSELQRSLERDGGYYVGDMVNKFLPGAMTAYDISVDVPLRPKQSFVTASGQIGVIIDMANELSLHMTALQRNMSSFIEEIRGTSKTKYRAPKNARGRSDAEASAFGFLDGDFLELFLHLAENPEHVKRIMDGRSEAERLAIPVERIRRVLETLVSMH